MSKDEKEKLTPEGFFSKGWVVCVGAIICCLLWGSAFPCVKIGYGLFGIDSSSWSSLLLFAGMRFALAGVMVICVYSIIRKRFVYPKAKNLWRVGVLSVFQTVAQYIFFYIGLSNISGVKSSVLNGLGVFFTILAACFLFRTEKFNLIKLAGCILGFGGVILINLGGEFTFDFTLTGEGFIIFSGLAGAIAAGFVKIFSKKEDPAVLSGYQFLLGGIILMIIGGAAGGSIPTVSVGAVFMLIYLAFISACAFTLQGFLIMYNPVSKVAVYKSTNPLFGALFSAIILGETDQLLSPMTLIALVLVCVGIFIINKYGEKRKKIPESEDVKNPADDPYGMYDPAYMAQGGVSLSSPDPPGTPTEEDEAPPEPQKAAQEHPGAEPPPGEPEEPDKTA
ncbi:MAG: DMT family transporter [Clostridia bacterium]|nr:DMT family transporter [Clostridia bacterium]